MFFYLDIINITRVSVGSTSVGVFTPVVPLGNACIAVIASVVITSVVIGVVVVIASEVIICGFVACVVIAVVVLISSEAVICGFMSVHSCNF